MKWLILTLLCMSCIQKEVIPSLDNTQEEEGSSVSDYSENYICSGIKFKSVYGITSKVIANKRVHLVLAKIFDDFWNTDRFVLLRCGEGSTILKNERANFFATSTQLGSLQNLAFDRLDNPVYLDIHRNLIRFENGSDVGLASNILSFRMKNNILVTLDSNRDLRMEGMLIRLSIGGDYYVPSLNLNPSGEYFYYAFYDSTERLWQGWLYDHIKKTQKLIVNNISAYVPKDFCVSQGRVQIAEKISGELKLYEWDGQLQEANFGRSNDSHTACRDDQMITHSNGYYYKHYNISNGSHKSVYLGSNSSIKAAENRNDGLVLYVLNNKNLKELKIHSF